MSAICGIVEFSGAPVDGAVLARMAEAVAARAPDGIRYWTEGHVGLAHLALHATPEAVREQQPLVIHGGRLCLVGDARVDNRAELIAALDDGRGSLPEAPTDADIVLAAYRRWGDDCPGHIIGDFAFAVWDEERRRLFLARDALGVRQMHYALVGQTFVFGTEAGQVLAHPGVRRRLDERAVADYLCHRFDDQSSTMYLDVRRLPAAHRMSVSEAGARIERYWDVDPGHTIVYRRDEDYVEHFLQVFSRAVGDRLRTQAGVLGATMSGGMDSTSVVAMAHKLLRDAGDPCHLVATTYTFDEVKECDERAYSSTMATELGVDVDFMPAEEHWFLREEVPFRDNPETLCLWQEALGRHMLARLHERGARVVLTGYSGDNVLQGSVLHYGEYLRRGQLRALAALRQEAKLTSLPLGAFVKRTVLRPLLPAAVLRGLRRLRRREPAAALPEWMAPDFARRTNLAERLAAEGPRRFASPARQKIYETAACLGITMASMSWYDATAARYGLEARHPYTDRRLVEFVVAVPPEQWRWAGVGKLLMRRAMVGLLPETVRQRLGKTNFDPFVHVSLRHKEVERVRALLRSSALAQMGVVDGQKLEAVYERYLAGEPVNVVTKLFPPLTLELWLRQYGHLLEGEAGRPAMTDAAGVGATAGPAAARPSC